MIRIPGTLYSIDLSIKKQDSSLIEFCISKNNQQEYSADVIDFDEIEFDLTDFLEENQVVVPGNRLETILGELEGKFYDLKQKAATTTMQKVALTQASNDALDSSKSSVIGQKVLLVGLNAVGKTSIYQVIFEGKLPHETHALSPTRGIQRHQINFPSISESKSQHSSNMKKGQNLILWDLGGQKNFIDRYMKEPEMNFGDTSCILYIIDAFNVDMYDEAREYLHRVIEMTSKYSNSPFYSTKNIFCFIHKMDQFPNRDEKFISLSKYFRLNPTTNQNNYDIQFFATSIFDSSIYSAWTKVIQTIMPKSSKLNLLAQQLKEDLGLYATLIIEKRTGLPICSSKTLLDDAALVGSTNRVLITIEKAIPEYELANLSSFQINTKNGILEVRLFDVYYILVLLYPPEIDLVCSDANERLHSFVETMKKSI